MKKIDPSDLQIGKRYIAMDRWGTEVRGKITGLDTLKVNFHNLWLIYAGWEFFEE